MNGNILAIALMAFPDLCRRRICRTCSQFSFALPCSSQVKCKDRPFFSMSRILSPWVPRNKWSILTHNPLSQWWQTQRNPGSKPLNKNHAARCASQCWPLILTVPYRLSQIRDPVQFKHPVFGSFRVFFRNAALAVSTVNWPYRPQHFCMAHYAQE